MSASSDGGPAFPGGVYGTVAGMSLRDWFAGQVLAGFLANPNLNTNLDNESVANAAYKMADDMLTARKAAAP